MKKNYIAPSVKIKSMDSEDLLVTSIAVNTITTTTTQLSKENTYQLNSNPFSEDETKESIWDN